PLRPPDRERDDVVVPAPKERRDPVEDAGEVFDVGDERTQRGLAHDSFPCVRDSTGRRGGGEFLGPPGRQRRQGWSNQNLEDFSPGGPGVLAVFSPSTPFSAAC